MRILSITILLAALFGLPAALAQGQEYSDPSVATPLNEGGYYAVPNGAVTAEVQPGAIAPGTAPKPKPKPNGNGNEASPSDTPTPKPRLQPMPPAIPMDPVQKGSIVDRLEAAEKQIDALQQHVLTGKSCEACDTCCDQSMSYAGLEIVALKVFESEGNYGNNDYQPGVRIWAGVQRADGLGLRIRWFDYTQNIAGAVVDIENLDLELTDAFAMGNWTGLVSGGLRYTEFRADAGDEDTNSFATGLTLGVQMNRALNDRFSIFAGLQESLLYGNDVAVPNTAICFSITEIQLGLQANRCLSGGATAFFRTGLEGQLYASAADGDSETIGLFGFFATVGVMR